MSIDRHQAVGAYRRWVPTDFDPQPQPEPQRQPPSKPQPEAAAPKPEPVVEAAAEVEEPAEPPVKLPTAADIEQIHEEARKSGYDAGYEEATARGRMEAMRLFGLVEDMDKALAELDASIAGSVLGLAIEIARQLVRKELASQPESALAVVREALQQMPQSHAMVHLHPEDAALVREYLGEQMAHVGHRIIEDDQISRGGCLLEAAGSRLDATLETRWRRIVANLGSDSEWRGDEE
ncbi:MAG: flagellar assembly protein FliH [Zoogloeaceae bacterium]|nr:flagellar assembly protein FliH [Zoogloeaceae bacterium]